MCQIRTNIPSEQIGKKNAVQVVFAVCTLQITVEHILDRKPGIYELTQFVLDLFFSFYLFPLCTLAKSRRAHRTQTHQFR